MEEIFPLLLVKGEWYCGECLTSASVTLIKQQTEAYQGWEVFLCV